jgi:hypothetical protein
MVMYFVSGGLLSVSSMGVVTAKWGRVWVLSPKHDVHVDCGTWLHSIQTPENVFGKSKARRAFSSSWSERKKGINLSNIPTKGINIHVVNNENHHIHKNIVTGERRCHFLQKIRMAIHTAIKTPDAKNSTQGTRGREK